MDRLNHFDEQGRARMVDVGDKPVTKRLAQASAQLRMKAGTLQRILAEDVGKGNVLEVARLAGIMATKRTSDLIPLCHPLPIDSVNIEFSVDAPERLRLLATVTTMGKTGVEMEALTAASVAGLTVYDMCKSIDRAMVLECVQLEQKSGGKSGHFQRSVHEDASVHDRTGSEL